MSDKPTLGQLLAAPVPLVIGGTTVQMRPMGWYQGCEAIAALLPALDDLPDLSQGGGDVDDDTTREWLLFVVQHRQEVSGFCIKASGFSEAEVQALQPTLLIELLLGLLEINADFFVRSLPALVKGAAGRLAAIQASMLTAMGSITPSPS